MKYLPLEKSRVAAPLIALVGIWVLFVYGVLGPEPQLKKVAEDIV